MQIETIYEDGILKFGKPLKFLSRKVIMAVIVPDEDIEAERDASCKMMNMLNGTGSGVAGELNRILGTYRGGGEERTAAYDKAIWRQHLVEKYLR